MATPWDFFIAYWIVLFAGTIGAAFLIIAVIASIDEIRIKVKKRRYRPAKKPGIKRGVAKK